jgi:hypothetical protein
VREAESVGRAGAGRCSLRVRRRSDPQVSLPPAHHPKNITMRLSHASISRAHLLISPLSHAAGSNDYDQDDRIEDAFSAIDDLSPFRMHRFKKTSPNMRPHVDDSEKVDT